MTKMKSITIYNVGDVILVPFPFTNLRASKRRPAVVVSKQSYQNERRDIILMAITSQIKMPLGYGECVLCQWKQAGLPKPSMLKPLIATIEQDNILKKLGTLTSVDIDKLSNVMSDLFERLESQA
ncbi:type II toxin-antitoxin system PemK/MazF family toxin [Fastidiosibacter lacustris]|uniref:type II toxin-antitoxin system PemK/MazF family toxin n=1 Tax=Fastidiosibacter lacustris TaxID=2056695 RepID=UPI0019578A37|nr:type II toxin-antitoxin system PemK/MazF family toxin [Fastidiosibacter lacustris]